MGRDPSKTERIVIYCDDETKKKFERQRVYHDDSAQLLRTLLEICEEYPEMVRTASTR